MGDGTKINVWLDNWCANEPLATLLAIQDISQLDISLKVSHFISSEKEWDLFKLKELVADAQLQLILATPICSSAIPDSICWGLFETGDFTTKSATWAAHELNPINAPSWEFSWIWHIDIMPKLKMFLWQLCHASLPTRGTLLKRELQINPLCPLCRDDIEDMEHLFLRCPIVHEVWQLAHAHNRVSLWFRQITLIAYSLGSPICVHHLLHCRWIG